MTLFQTVEFILTLKANCFELTPSRGLKRSLVFRGPWEDLGTGLASHVLNRGGCVSGDG